MTLKAGPQARTIEFETTRYSDGSAQVRARLRPADGKPDVVTSSPLDPPTLTALVAMLEGVRGSVHVPVDPPAPSWTYGEAPRGVRLLVTAKAQGVLRLYVATLSPDHDDQRWFSEGRRIYGVVAWMFLPPEAKEPT